MTDSILCSNKEEAKEYGDEIGWENIKDWEFLPEGNVGLILNEGVKE